MNKGIGANNRKETENLWHIIRKEDLENITPTGDIKGKRRKRYQPIMHLNLN